MSEVERTAAELSEDLGGYGIQRLPLTAAIPYNLRWRINELKLLLSDLQFLAEKHKIKSAADLYATVSVETEELCVKLREFILQKRKWREELSK